LLAQGWQLPGSLFSGKRRRNEECGGDAVDHSSQPTILPGRRGLVRSARDRERSSRTRPLMTHKLQ
jgi:hypothetical protein